MATYNFDDTDTMRTHILDYLQQEGISTTTHVIRWLNRLYFEQHPNTRMGKSGGIKVDQCLHQMETDNLIKRINQGSSQFWQCATKFVRVEEEEPADPSWRA